MAARVGRMLVAVGLAWLVWGWVAVPGPSVIAGAAAQAGGSSALRGVSAAAADSGNAAAGALNAVGGSGAGASEVLIYTAAPRYEPNAWLHGGERFPLGAALWVDARGVLGGGANGGPGRGVEGEVDAGVSGARLLVPGFAASADAQVSFDGTRVLFAGRRRAGDEWQIYEVAVTGGEPRAVTHGGEAMIRPLYLPDMRVVYAHRVEGRFVLEAAGLDGGKAVRLSYAPGNFLPEDVLRDGRVLFASGFPLGTGGAAEIYTVYSDGSGVEAVRCNHVRGAGGRWGARQMASGDIVFTHGVSAGAGSVRRVSAGGATAHGAAGVLGAGLGRFTSALAEEVAVATPRGEYAGDVAQTGAGDWIVSWRAGNAGPYAMMRWRPGARTLTEIAARNAAAPEVAATNTAFRKNAGMAATGSVRTRTAVKKAAATKPAAGVSLVEPVVVAARAVPNRHPSALHDWTTANLLTLDAHESRGGRMAASIAAVRVYTADEAGRAMLLGTSPVEADGSFFVEVAGDRPVRFELLDGAGKVVRAEAGWMWARPGEQRICVGCHAGPERAPENAVPAVLLRTQTPVDLTGRGAAAAGGGH